MIVHLKEAGLETPVLTNRNGIQRLVREGKQAHLCEARNQWVDVAVIGRRISALPGEISDSLETEKSAEVIVVDGNEQI